MARPRPVPPYFGGPSSASGTPHRSALAFSAEYRCLCRKSSNCTSRRGVDRMLALHLPPPPKRFNLTAAFPVAFESHSTAGFSAPASAASVGDECSGPIGIESDVERQLRFRLRAVMVFPDVSAELDVRISSASTSQFRIRSDRSDIADHVRQVVPAPWIVRAHSTCFGQIASGIFGGAAAENQDAVERRTQLVRHVGDEFRLVFRGERSSVAVFLERAPGLLYFWFFLSTSTLRSSILLRLCSILSVVFAVLRCWSSIHRRAVFDCVNGLRSARRLDPLRTIPMLSVSCSRKVICEVRDERRRTLR